MLSGTGDLGASLSKVIQGPNEKFADFHIQQFALIRVYGFSAGFIVLLIG